MKQIAIDNTITNLTGAGLQASVTDKINDILLRAVTSGAKYADLTKELHEHLTATDKGSGALSKYANTYATTAISQYAGENNKILTDDLGLEWFEYVGSNIETTREFCEHLTEKRYIHKSEIKTILKGEIDGHQCEIYEKTGLPKGMIEGTTEQNFQVNCGGWNCRHQLVPVAREAVPKDIRDKIEFAGSRAIMAAPNSAQMNMAIENAKINDIEYIPVKKAKVKLTDNDIIKRLAVKKEDACSSLAFAYLGNKIGFDVTDNRGGMSLKFFANPKNINDICRGVGGVSSIDYDGFASAKNCLKKVKAGKEYYFSTGRHAAVIRRENGKLEYLELQKNILGYGWHQFTRDTLKDRFDVAKTRTHKRIKHYQPSFIIDCDLLKDNNKFEEILGYINTNK